MSTIKVLDKQTNEILFECDVKESDKAFEYAAQMDELGIDVIVDSPSVTKTLSFALGASAEQWKKIEEEINDEIESHNGSDSGKTCNSHCIHPNPSDDKLQ